MIRRIRSVLFALLVVASIGGLVVAGASPASAGRSFRTDLRATWAYTDARTPLRSYVDVDGSAPVGVWQDDDRRFHLSKSYFTFDLAQLRGARVFSATAFTSEVQANDCGTERAAQLWLTDATTRPTWARPPRERVLLDGQTLSECLALRVAWDATEGLRQAIAAGQTQATLALRMSSDRQGEFRYGRRYGNDLRITIAYNLPPNIPVELSTDERPCANGSFPTSNDEPILAARLSDPDQTDLLTAAFELWPVDQPDQRTRLTSAITPDGTIARAWVPVGVLEHARTYVWAVRAEDGDDVSAWTAPCQFSTDFVGPDVEPTVSSVVYPENCDGCGGVGVPGEFVFTANGVADVVGFYYGQNEHPFTFVSADHPGGQATITFTPQRDGPHDLFVASVDQAGTRSPTRLYRFFVRDDSPIVSCTPENGGVGVAHECTLAPAPFVDNVVAYTYRFADGPDVTVAAGPDQRATVSITPSQPAGNRLVVRSTTSTGAESTPAFRYFTTSPDVASDIYVENTWSGGPGIVATFAVTPRMPDVIEYIYEFAGEAEVTIPARTDGTASVQWAPTQPGEMWLNIRSRSSDGTISETRTYTFYVNS